MVDAAQYVRESEGGEPLSGSLFERLHRYRFALWNLILKDFRVRYRNMSLGVLWSLLNPLVMLGVLVIVFSYIHPSRHANFFPIFLLLGMVTYNFFSLCLPPATNAVVENAALVKKVIFPRELIPVSVVLSQVVHLLIQLALLLVFLLLFRVPPRTAWLLVPALFAAEMVFIMGAAMLCSALNVFYRDILYLVQSLLTVLFWLTPIFYDLKQVKLNLPRPLYLLYILNPLAGYIDAVRFAVLGERPLDLEALCMALAVTLFTLLLGMRVFRARQPHFADKL